MRTSPANFDTQSGRMRRLLPSAFVALSGALSLCLAWVRYDIASSFAQDAKITPWTALTDASAVARSANVEAGIAALQKLVEAVLSGFTGIMFLATALMLALPVLSRVPKRETASGEQAAVG